MKNPIKKLIFFQPIRFQHLATIDAPFRRFFRKKIWSGVTTIDISSCLSIKSSSNTNDMGRYRPYSSLGHRLRMECLIKVMQYFNKHLSMDDYQNLKRRLHCLVAGVERTWWRLCQLTLELRLVQTGVRFEKWADVVLSIVLEVPPRRAPEKSQKNKFLSHVTWEFLIFFRRNDFSFRWKNSE
jgi:hypothetical protein